MNQDQNINPEDALRAGGQSGTDFGEPKQIADGITAFGPVVYSYTRAQAVADGVQVEVSKVAVEAGIRFPVFLTRTVYDAFVTVPEGVTAQDEAGRLWDIVWMLRDPPRKTWHAPLARRALCPQQQPRRQACETHRHLRPTRH